MLGTAAAACLAILMTLLIYEPGPPGLEEVSEEAVTKNAVHAALVSLMGDQNSESLIKLLEENGITLDEDWITPLTNEMKNLSHDAEALQKFFQALLPVGRVMSRKQ